MKNAIYIAMVVFIIIGFSFMGDNPPVGVVYLLLAAGCVFLALSLERRSDEQDPKATENELNRARGNAINAISKINHDYALDLTEVDLLDIADSEHPFDIIAEKITPRYPTISDFFQKTDEMLTQLSEEMNLSEKQCENIAMYFLRDTMPNLTDELLRQIADNFSAQLPREFYFLKNKINYELSTLGMIMTVAQQTNDYDMQQKVQALRKKRGYI